MAHTEQFSCLLLDDDVGFTSMLAKIVSEEGGRPVPCHTVSAAREQLAEHQFDLVILDNGLPDGSGYEFYSHVLRRSPASVVAMVTGAPELSQAVELTRNGLFDYLTKPLDARGFAGLLRRAKLRLCRPALESETDVLLGGSPKIREVLVQLEQAARHTEATVLLLGETGTGKDLAARCLHRLTCGPDPAKAPYVALNCPNVPADMFEAELFGSEKGAYTGADRRRIGLGQGRNAFPGRGGGNPARAPAQITEISRGPRVSSARQHDGVPIRRPGGSRDEPRPRRRGSQWPFS